MRKHSNTWSHAKTELDILVKSFKEKSDSPLVEPFIPEMLALIDKFGKSGQSGGSAPYVGAAICNTLKVLMQHKPICPITGMDEEWVDVSEYNDGKPLFQNKRCSAIFKGGKNGRAYYLDAIVWQAEKDNTFTGMAIDEENKKVYSRQFIKFPFEPKTFYVHVILQKNGTTRVSVLGGRQLAKARKYFSKPSI
jgi:hypothetical protein